MKYLAFLLLSSITLSLSATRLAAEHAVTLKSDLTLIGDVAFEGADLVVQLGEAKLRVPLKDVAAVVPIGSTTQAPPAKNQLLTALEARLLNNAQGEVVGLLAEASRQAPDDPQVAFWYATSLLDAGFGKAAHDVLEPRRDAVAKVYPGVTDRLAARIQDRVKLEALPPALLKRIDQLNAEAEHHAADADSRRFAALFRVVDQDQTPVDQNAIHVQGHGSDELLEPFPDGYYLYTFNRSRNSSRQPCHVDVNQVGLKPAEFEVPADVGVAGPPRELAVRRFKESDRRPVRIRVADDQDAPIAGARVELAPTNVSDESLSAVTDKDGTVELAAFPMIYLLRVNADGFKAESEGLEVRENARKQGERQVKLYRTIKASLRAVWRMTPLQPGGEATSGETTIPLGLGATPLFQDHQAINQTIRPMQVKDQLMIQFALNPYGGFPTPAPAETMWLRAVEVDSDEEGAALQEKVEAEFAALDLKDLENLKEELKPVEFGHLPVDSGTPRGPGIVAAKPGTIYVGKLHHRDHRTGQFAELAFKVMVEEVSLSSPPDNQPPE